MWFEWNEFYGYKEIEAVNVSDCGDCFLEAPRLREDVISVYKRLVLLCVSEFYVCHLYLF